MKRAFTVSELIKAVVPVKLKVEKEETLRLAKVLPSCVERKLVDTKLARLAVLIKPGVLEI
jgi:O-succinylbenzoate synthase